MSRFADYDNDEEDWALNMGRWQHNARVALKGKRGRKVLRELREALMALPEHRLIEGAMCTVGGVDKRLPPVPIDSASTEVLRYSRWAHEEREQARKRLATKGEGVCAIGAIVWYRKVKAGADPAEAFASLPTVLDAEDGDGLEWTARLGEEAGLTFTLAWELAYRNDETLRNMTPEERHAAFVAWIDQELASDSAAA